jgi:hypothetical protein
MIEMCWALVNQQRLIMTLRANELELLKVSARLASLGKCGLINFYRLSSCNRAEGIFSARRIMQKHRESHSEPDPASACVCLYAFFSTQPKRPDDVLD